MGSSASWLPLDRGSPRMTDVEFRVPLGFGKHLHDIVFAPGKREMVAFCLVSHIKHGNRTVLLVRDILTLADEDYLDDSKHGAAWRGAAMLPVIERAMGEGLGIVLVHAHDAPERAGLSRDDVQSARRLVPMFRARVPGRPHASLVLARGTAAAYVALPGREPAMAERVSVRWMGKALVDWPGTPKEPTVISEAFTRQALVVGDQGTLSSARVVVVGLCGGGGHVVQQLAHVGVGRIVGIDADVYEKTNLHRGIGMRRADALASRAKTEVMRRLVEELGTGSTFEGIDARVPDPRTVDAIRSADVVVGCVDNLHARADIQEIVWRNLVPYVDVGVSIRAVDSATSTARAVVGGNVFVFIPGGFCAWCCGLLSEEKLQTELNGPTRAYFENKKGDAQVVSFNGSVASQAVSEVLLLLTGYRGVSFDPADLATHDKRQRGALKLDGIRGTMEEWGAVRRPSCVHCNGHLGAGAVLWSGPA